MEFFVAEFGNDQWSGTIANVNNQQNDGPFATIERAQQAVRDWHADGHQHQQAIVRLRGGRYHLSNSLQFHPEDSFAIYTAYRDEKPVIDGGVRISEWREETVNGVACWVADLPLVREGDWFFRQLFVNGERRTRARFPKNGVYWIADVPGTAVKNDINDFLIGNERFVCAPGDIQAWHNLSDVEVIVHHYWIEERMPIKEFDPATNLVTSSRRSMFALRDDVAQRYARYIVEHVFEALSEPGEWYLDRGTGKLYYIPMPGEHPEHTQVVAPRVAVLVDLIGNPDNGSFVEHIEFEGLTFEYSKWEFPEPGHPRLNECGLPPVPEGTRYAAAPQAAVDTGGAIHAIGARNCAINHCEMTHIGGYVIEFGDGCLDNNFVGNHLSDLGAGGIKLDGAGAAGPTVRQSGRARVTDNHIHGGGRIVPSGIGIIVTHAYEVDIAHNRIYDFFYSGISAGWIWGYERTVTANIRIENNHISDLGHGELNDMGGIYLLGIQPGTVVRGNLIHDIQKRNYGGWAIYLDEGSSHILVENNVCYRTSSHGFHVHYGRENIVRNNVFAFGAEGQASLSRAESQPLSKTSGESLSIIERRVAGRPPHNSFTFQRNIVIMKDTQPAFTAGYAGNLERKGFKSDLNLFWNVSGGEIISGNETRGELAQWKLSRSFTWDEWRELGNDRNSLIADPGCENLEADDFSLAPNSPAFTLGFEAIDTSQVGPRPIGEQIKRYDFALSR